MADENNEKKDNKRPKRTTKIVYHRCGICGARKRESDMTVWHMNKAFCNQCREKKADSKGSYNEVKASKKMS